jgi:hypothetical protein
MKKKNAKKASRIDRKLTRPDKPRRRARASSTRPTAGRVNTIRGNGALPESMEAAPEKVSIGEAMRQAVEALGDVVIDTTLAPSQMRELAAIYEDITQRQAVYAAKADEAKVAKKSLESATELLLQRVRDFTHPAPLPLFDAAEREADEADMLSGGDVDDDGDAASL